MAHAPAHRDASGAPLSGRSVVVTRAAEQSRELAGPLEALGAEVVACPVIEIVDPPDFAPVDEAISRLSKYDWVVFTSANAVRRFFARLDAVGGSRDSLASLQLAAVGESTARVLASFGFTASFVPPMSFRAEALAEEFVARGVGLGWRVLIPRALDAREVLPETLRGLGAVVDVAPVYQTLPATPCAETLERLRDGGFDAVTFTSPSTVRNFLALLQEAGLDPSEVMAQVAAASIGPVTSEALRGSGFEAAVEAHPSTVAALATELAAHLSAG